MLLLNRRLLRGRCLRNGESFDQELLELFAVGVCPFFSSLLPGQFAAFFTFGPFVLPDLFFDKIRDPLKWIGVNQGRYLNVFLSI